MSDYVGQIVESNLETGWASATPIAWDNVKYKAEVGVDFIRPTLDNVYSEAKGIRCNRQYFQLTVEVYTEVGKGNSPNSVLCDAVLGIFVGKEIGGVTFTNGVTQRIGEEEEWYHQNVVIDLYYDHSF